MTEATCPPGFISINDAAANLGVKPWEVTRLADCGRIRSLTLIDAASLREYQEKTA